MKIITLTLAGSRKVSLLVNGNVAISDEKGSENIKSTVYDGTREGGWEVFETREETIKKIINAVSITPDIMKHKKLEQFMNFYNENREGEKQ